MEGIHGGNGTVFRTGDGSWTFEVDLKHFAGDRRREFWQHCFRFKGRYGGDLADDGAKGSQFGGKARQIDRSRESFDAGQTGRCTANLKAKVWRKDADAASAKQFDGSGHRPIRHRTAFARTTIDFVGFKTKDHHPDFVFAIDEPMERIEHRSHGNAFRLGGSDAEGQEG